MPTPSDTEDQDRDTSAKENKLRNLPEHEHIVEHFYDP